MTEWIKSDEQEPPTDAPFWAYLYDNGVKLMHWEGDSGDCDVFSDAGYFELMEPKEHWEPLYWLPFDALPFPPDIQGLPDFIVDLCPA